MNKAKKISRFSKLLGSTVLAVSASFASAEILNFDDLPAFEPVPSGYHGLSFSSGMHNWHVRSDTANAHSGSNYIEFSTSGASALSLFHGSGFTFDGLWVRGPASPFNQSFQITAYVDNFFLARQDYSATSEYQFFAFSIPGNSRPNLVTISAVSGGLLFIDDVCVNGGCNTTVTAVPEPSSYALMIAGIGLLGFARSRRSRKAVQGRLGNFSG